MNVIFQKPVTILLCCMFSVVVMATEKPAQQPLKGSMPDMIEKAAQGQKQFAKDMENNPRYQHEARGDELMAQRDFNGAIKEFDAAIALDPKSDSVYVKKGIALYSSGKPADAVPMFDKALQNSVRSETWAWLPLYHKGMAQGMVGDMQGALKSLNDSIALAPGDENHMGRAMVYMNLQQPYKAQADIKAALKFDPNNQRLRAIDEVIAVQLSGAEFQEKMAARKGAEKTASGLIYSVVKAGSGASPKATDTVKVHYHGTLPDGTVFDSSVDRGEPATFPLNGVIPCWTEGVQKMKVGGKSQLVCPPDIAYGNRRVGEHIKPGSTLVFEVELLGVE